MRIFILWYGYKMCDCCFSAGAEYCVNKEVFEGVFKTHADAVKYAEEDGVKNYFIDEDTI